MLLPSRWALAVLNTNGWRGCCHPQVCMTKAFRGKGATESQTPRIQISKWKLLTVCNLVFLLPVTTVSRETKIDHLSYVFQIVGDSSLWMFKTTRIQLLKLKRTRELFPRENNFLTEQDHCTLITFWNSYRTCQICCTIGGKSSFPAKLSAILFGSQPLMSCQQEIKLYSIKIQF